MAGADGTYDVTENRSDLLLLGVVLACVLGGGALIGLVLHVLL